MTKRIPLLLLIFLVGCRNDEADMPNPDYTVGLTGTYALVYYRQGNQSLTLPTSYLSGQFDVTKVDITHLQAKLIMVAGVTSNLLSTNTVELKRDALNPALYTMMKSGRRVGTITAATINVQDTTSDGLITEIKGNR